MLKNLLIGLIGLLFLPQSGQPTAEAVSLLGKPLAAPPISAEARKTLEANLKQAEIAYGRDPGDPDAIIWLGRRLAYLGRYRDAIEVFTKGIEKHPADARMYRHRGHRYLTVRALPKAIADFTKAAELVAGKPDQVEPDGQPNARNTPTSTLQSNIYYHLALAHYVSGELAKAADGYAKCMAVSTNPDMLVATTYWYYLALARQGQQAEAAALLGPINAKMDIIENASYHRLLLMFKGELTPDSLLAPGAAGLDAVTTRYGIAAWHLSRGQRDAAMPLLREVVDGHPNQWPAFGYLAAEAELAPSRKQ
jgi:tetratricopeptide (TPR) repeat protein